MKSISEFARDILPNTIIKAKDLISLIRVVAIICNSFSSRLTQRSLQLSRLPIDFGGALLPLSIACQTPETRHSTFVAGRLKTLLLLPNNFPSIFIFSQPDKLRMSQMTIRRPFGELDCATSLFQLVSDVSPHRVIFFHPLTYLQA